MRWVVLPLIALLITLIASCGGDGDSGTVTPTPSASASPTIAAGEYPTGFLDFVRILDRDLATGAIDLTAFTRFTGWDCPSNLFPGSGMSCGPAEEGKGVPAIDIGAEGSEGELYDSLSYNRYLLDWIYEKPPASSDAYGDGAPRVYAIADEQDRAESYQGQLGTYEVFATRLVTSPTDQSVGRSTLTFFVSGTMQGWLITGVLRVPDVELDPNSAQARAEQVTDIFKTWRRWDEPQPPGPLASRWPSALAQRQIAYIDTSNALHVAGADTGSDSVIVNAICEAHGGGGSKAPVSWSSDAQRIAVMCSYVAAGAQPYLEVYDTTSKAEPAVIDNISRFIWSPVGHRIAYQTVDVTASPPEAIVRLRDPDSGQDTLVSDKAVFLAWPRPDQLLLGLNPMTKEGGMFLFQTYEANWYDLDTGATQREERFDNNAQFWISAPINKAVVLSGPSTRKEGGVTLGVYDLATGQETTLDGLAIGYPSEGIPKANVQTSPVTDLFVWADFGTPTGGVAISEAALDGSHANRLGVVPELIDGVSSDGLVLFQAHDTVMTLSDLKSGAETTWHNATVGAIAPVPIPRS